MLMKPESLDKPRQIICEGSADKEFFGLLLAARGMDDRFQVHEARGKDNIGRVLAGLRAVRGWSQVRTIVVAIDSDSHPDARVAEVCQQIEADCGPTLTPPAEALCFSEGVPAVGIVPIPWADRPGCLETLLYEIAFLSPEGAGARECVETFSQCVGISRWDLTKQAKMRWYALVAGVNERDPGRATTYLLQGQPELFDLYHPSLDPLAQFLASVP